MCACQDFLTGGYLLTQKDIFFTREAFCGLVAYLGDANEHIDMPPPAIFKPQRYADTDTDTVRTEGGGRGVHPPRHLETRQGRGSCVASHRGGEGADSFVLLLCCDVVV